MPNINEITEAIASLPDNWHKAGTVPTEVLWAILRHTEGLDLAHSVETGTGKTTLLLSHLSRDHRVFANRDDSGSIEAVLASALFQAEHVEYVEGATQRMLPGYSFDNPLQLVLLDGPHGFPFVEMEYWHLYPHVEHGGLFILDDIHIPTIHQLYLFIREDDMFEELELVGSTAFFRRTRAPCFEPFGDGWWLQNYNKARHPVCLTDDDIADETPALQEQIDNLSAQIEALRETTGSAGDEQLRALASLGRELSELAAPHKRRGWRRLLG